MGNIPWYYVFIIIVAIVFFAIVGLGMYDKNIKKRVDKDKKDKKLNKDNPFVKKLYNPNQKSKEIKTKIKQVKQLSEFEQVKQYNLNLQKSNKQYLGVYNYFGSKTSMRLKPLVFVQEKKNSCYLCQPWENKVLSLNHHDDKYNTMKQAIEKGYHHVGCTHEDIDYLIMQSKIEKNYFSSATKNKNFNLKLEQFKYEKQIRLLKASIRKNPNNSNEINKKLELYLNQYQEFLTKNNLKRNLAREDINANDTIIFS